MKYKIPWAKPYFYGNEARYVNDALKSTWISGGRYVDEFEMRFRKTIGARHGLSVSNGTTALHLVLLGLGLRKGDEVIVPGYTFVAPVNMVIVNGAKPVYADIDPDTWCVSPEEIRKKVTRRTRAVIAVHLYGNCCDMKGIKTATGGRGISVIEDTAEACLSKEGDRFAGTIGDAGCFSFQATKTITMGEGGFVACRSKDLADRLKIIRDHGMDRNKRYWHHVVGFNFRLTNMQAAMGVAQLENARDIVAAHDKVVGMYKERLRGLSGLTFQHITGSVSPVIWTVAVKLDPRAFRVSRDGVIKKLAAKGIETRPGFYSFRAMPAYRAGRLKVSEDVGSKLICLPTYSSISERDVDMVCGALKSLMR